MVGVFLCLALGQTDGHPTAQLWHRVACSLARAAHAGRINMAGRIKMAGAGAISRYVLRHPTLESHPSPPRRILAQARLDACPSWERVAGVRGTLVRADASNVCIVRAHLCFMSIKAEGCRRSSSICRTMLTVLLR